MDFANDCIQLGKARKYLGSSVGLWFVECWLGQGMAFLGFYTLTTIPKPPFSIFCFYCGQTGIHLFIVNPQPYIALTYSYLAFCYYIFFLEDLRSLMGEVKSPDQRTQQQWPNFHVSIIFVFFYRCPCSLKSKHSFLTLFPPRTVVSSCVLLNIEAR